MAKRKKPKKPERYCWVVAYIDKDFIPLVERQLEQNPEYNDVEAYIPTIKVLKKKFKGENHFDEVPLLFNYGFFKIPRKLAVHRNFLDNMQKNISCIYGWVKDPHRSKSRISVATATPDEISRLVRASETIGAHTAEDLSMIKVGDIITLKGYPFEGIEAELLSIDEKRRKVKVNIIIFESKKPVEVSFDNVFFTLYQNNNYDDTKLSKNSLDEMEQRHTLDRFMNKSQKNGANS